MTRWEGEKFIEYVQSAVWTFGIAGDWKATALDAGVWVETVMEGRQRLMAARRNEDEDEGRHRQEKRERQTHLNLLRTHPVKGKERHNV